MFVSILLMLVGAYAIAGIVFAAAFVTAGVGRVDPAADGTAWGFRLVIFPGAAALWPMLLIKWRHAIRQGGQP